MTVKWQNPSAMEVLKLHVEKVAYPEYGEYSDDSGKILKEIMDNPESESEGSDVELDWLKKYIIKHRILRYVNPIFLH